MALITCPECGKQISSYAKACPECGFPILEANSAGTVMVKICNGLAGKVRIYNMADLSILWQGKAGQVATFDVSIDTEIGICWGLGKPEKCKIRARVKGNERYELAESKGFFSYDIVLNKIDIVDSK